MFKNLNTTGELMEHRLKVAFMRYGARGKREITVWTALCAIGEVYVKA
jgi:hypothetical protein